MQKKRKYSITFNEKKFTTKTGIVVNPIMLKDSVESGYAPSVVLKKYIEKQGYGVESVLKGTEKIHNVSVKSGNRTNYYVVNIRENSKKVKSHNKSNIRNTVKGTNDSLNRKRTLEYSKNHSLLYHGSDGGILGNIRCDSNKGLCDFGEGFYTGDYLKQAEGRVINSNNPVIYAFEYDLRGKTVYEFEDGVLWALFVAYNRHKLKFKGYNNLVSKFKAILKHDVIIGLIADDKMSVVYDNFLKGYITDICLLESLKLVKYGKQYVFKNDVSANTCLRKVSEYKLTESMLKGSILWSKKVRSNIEDTVESYSKKYRRVGRYFDECMEEYNK